ncbi:aldehyde dehydrogenase family protein [Nocardioides iriomotensis]|uniref:Aldehyde dehydrogenase family protein n=1 Tax=Nocardioides iriomotensis TaxID=715784 RepID=A0A4Q5J9Z2_9ACTN|nr:aldehyde dehydrogenase family protein [Nocardioides iriomotensis]RYU14838.1 aldehyde dehydrogenase family protein [Nocardioides iriomotensis]
MTTHTIALRHLVGGVWTEGLGSAAHSENPADPDGAAVADYTTATSEQLEQAMAAAAAAARGWDQQGLLGRGQVLRRAAQLMEQRSEGLAILMTREQGKSLADSRGEVGATVETLYYHAAAARRPDGATYPSAHPDELIRTVRRPVGTVAVITPWNFPLQIPVWKIAPALLWGNPVVWKPASDTPAMAVALAEILVEAGVPDGVLNLLLGPGHLGAELVAHPQAAAVTFTGSVPVGRAIRDAALPRGAKLQMELGGHNAALVLPDADLAAAADAIVAAAMGSTGQKCTATRRVIAVGDCYDRLVDELVTRVEKLSVGNGLEPGAALGPVVSARARDQVVAAVQLAVDEGAEVLATGTVPAGPGHWVAPTLLAGVSDLTICREEVFGPVTTMLRADDLDAAISLANATDFGLTAAVFTRDERSARRCVDELVAGLVKVNAPSTGSELHAPFGGLRDSSFPAPREQASDSAAEFFTISKTAYLRLSPKDPS